MAREEGLIEKEDNGLCKTYTYVGRRDNMVTCKEYACGDMYLYFEGRKDGLTAIKEYDIPECLCKDFEGRRDGKVREEYDYNPETDEYVLDIVSYENREDGLSLEEYHADNILHRFYWDGKEVILTPEQQEQENLDKRRRRIEENKENYRHQREAQRGLRKTIKSEVFLAYRHNRFLSA